MDSKDTSILIVKKVPGIPYVRIVQGTGIHNEFMKHVHSQLCVGIVLSGVRRMTFDGDRYDYSKNDIFIINPGQAHSCAMTPGTEHSYSVLTVDPSSTGDPDRISFRNIIKKSNGIHGRFVKLLSILERDAPVLEKESTLQAFLNSIASAYSTEALPVKITAQQKSAVKKARELLEKNLTDKITLDELSGVTGMSRFYFNRIFCEITGVSPYAFHLHLRIEHAKHMLLAGRTIVETALDSGFTDQSHFSRYFKKLVGVTPGAFVRYNRQEGI